MSNTIKIKQIDQTQLAAFVNDILDGTGAVYTANRALVTDGAGDVTTSSVTATELGYLSGVTSAIQTQFNNLGSTYLALAGGTMTGPITLHSSSLLKWGDTASFPALKRSSTELQVRLADDSGYAPIAASSIVLNVPTSWGPVWTLGSTSGEGYGLSLNTNGYGMAFVVRGSGPTGPTLAEGMGVGNLYVASRVGWGQDMTIGREPGSSTHTYIFGESSGVLGQRNSTNAQTFRVYGTYTDASNYVRASLAATSTSVTLSAETAGTGADNVDVNITPAGTGSVNLGSKAKIGTATLSHDGFATLSIDSVIAQNATHFSFYGNRAGAGTWAGMDGFAVRDSSFYAFANVGYWYGTIDLALARNAAGVAEINNGTPGTYRDLKLRTLYGEGGTVTASAPVLDISQTWNNGAVAFTGAKINVTNTASDAASRPFDVQVNGTSLFSVIPGAGPIDGGVRIGNARFDTYGGGSFVTVSTASSPGGWNNIGFEANWLGCAAAYPGIRWYNGAIYLAYDVADALYITSSANSFSPRDLKLRTLQGFYSYTDGSNYQGYKLTSGASSVTLSAETAGTGADNVDVNITPAGTGKVVTPAIVSANSYEFSSGASITSASLQTLVFVGEYGGMRMEIGQDVLARKFLCSGEFAIGWGAGYGTGNLLSIGAAFYKDTDNVIAQRNSTNAQTMRVYGTYTDGSNYVRASLAATSTSVTLAAETAGTGADDVSISLNPAGTGVVGIGGLTSSYPALKRSSTELQVRLADDSGYANIRAANLITQGELQTDNPYLYMRIAGMSALILGADILVYQRFLSFGSGGANYADCSIGREAAGVLALRNDHYYAGFVSHTLRIYGARTDDSNYVRASLAATSTSVTLAAETAGTGADNIDLNLVPAGTGQTVVTSLYAHRAFTVPYQGGKMIQVTALDGRTITFGSTVSGYPAIMFGNDLTTNVEANGVIIGQSGSIAISAPNGVTLGASGGFAVSGPGTFVSIGGTSASYPALKRSSTELQVRLADDSGYATTAAGCFTSHGSIVDPSSGGYWMLRHRNSDGGAYWGFSQKSGGTGDIQVWIEGYARATLGSHIVVANTNGGFSWSTGPGAAGNNLSIIRDTTDVVAIYGTTNAALRLYGAYTDGSNYVRASLAATSTSVTLAAETAGTGADNVDVYVTPAGSGLVQLGAGANKATVDQFGQVTASGGGTLTSNTSGSFGAFQVCWGNGEGIGYGGTIFRSGFRLTWSQYGNQAQAGHEDTGLARNAAGVVEVNNGTLGTYRDIKARNFYFGDSAYFIFNGSRTYSSHNLVAPAIVVGSVEPIDVILERDASAILALRNSTNAQTLRVYGTYTDASNYVRASLSAAASSVTLAAQTAGTGADDVDVSINPAGAGRVYFLSNGLQLDSYGTGVRLFGVSYIQNNSAPIRILCGASDGIAVLDTGGVTIDNPVSPDTVATLKLNARGTQLAPLFNAGGFTVNGTGTFVTFGHQNSASYPALKRSSTELQVRLADDSGYAGINAASYTFSGGASLNYNGSEISSTHRLLSSTGLVSEGYLAIGPWPNYTYLYAAGADIFEQRRTTNAQTFRIYGTYTDGSNFVRASLAATSTSVTLAAETAGTGADDVDVNVTAAGNGGIVLNTEYRVALNGTSLSSHYAIVAPGVNVRFTQDAVGSYTQRGFAIATDGGWRFAVSDNTSNKNIGIQSDYLLGWVSGNVTSTNPTLDTGLARNAAGVVEVNNGTLGTYRDMRLRTITVDAADGNGLQFNGGGSVEAYSNYLTLTSPYTGFAFYSPQVGANVLTTDNTTLDIALHTRIASNKAIYFTSGGEISAASNVLNIKAYTSFVLSTTGGSTRRVAEISNTGELYGFYSYTDASNYQGYKLTSGASSVTLSAETAGTGADDIDLILSPAGAGKVGIGTASPTQLLSVGSVFKVSSTGVVTIKTGGSGLGGNQGLVAADGVGGIALENGTLRIEPMGAASRTTIGNGSIYLGDGAVESLKYDDSTDQFWLSQPLSFAEGNAPNGVYDMIRWGDGAGTSSSNPTYVAVSALKTAANEYGLTFDVSTAATKSERMRLSPTGFLGIGTTSPTHLLSLGGNSARTIWMERHTTSDTAGNNLTVQAGSATSGATNKAGGYLDLLGGISTGTGESGVRIKGYVAGSSGTSDTSASTMIEVLGNKVGFFGVTPVVRQTTGIAAATFVANTSAIADDTATWGGYTAGQIVTALKNVGILT